MDMAVWVSWDLLLLADDQSGVSQPKPKPDGTFANDIIDALLPAPVSINGRGNSNQCHGDRQPRIHKSLDQDSQVLPFSLPSFSSSNPAPSI
jgi:hypothetical protein